MRTSGMKIVEASATIAWMVLASQAVANASPSTAPSHGQTAPLRCDFKDIELPLDVVVYATGAYAGAKTNYQIDQSGHEATRFDITVNSPDKPVVLMLSAYEPSVWTIQWTSGTRIVAALLTGYYRQAVAGLPHTTPIINSSYANKGACGSFYLSETSLAEANPLARRTFGQPVSMIYPAGNGKVVLGPALPLKASLEHSDDVPLRAFRDSENPLAGEAGLALAVKKGQLRKATQADAQAWADALAQHQPKPDVPPIAGKGLKAAPASFYGGYVVLKALTLPAGLYGAHSTSFFVPKGVPRPVGNLGHSTLYDYNSLTCSGSDCPR